MMQQRPGVYIEQGPQNFEIIQRNSKDCADISEALYSLSSKCLRLLLYILYVAECLGRE